MHPGKLLLLPNLLDENSSHDMYLPSSVATAVRSIQGMVTESEKTARRYLRRFLSHEEMAKIPLKRLNEHTKPPELSELVEPMERGEWWGLLTDAGLPCLADPGADLVALARSRSIAIETFTGPSSIVLALQLSGLVSQRFAFHGYLPRESPALEEMIRMLEKRSMQEGSIHIFIEAPYRSQKLFETLLNTLRSATKLSVAASLTTPEQKVFTLSVQKIREAQIALGKEPAVFLFQA